MEPRIDLLDEISLLEDLFAHDIDTYISKVGQTYQALKEFKQSNTEEYDYLMLRKPISYTIDLPKNLGSKATLFLLQGQYSALMTCIDWLDLIISKYNTWKEGNLS